MIEHYVFPMFLILKRKLCLMSLVCLFHAVWRGKKAISGNPVKFNLETVAYTYSMVGLCDYGVYIWLLVEEVDDVEI